MDCSEAVYSDDYYDLIVNDDHIIVGAEDVCQQKIRDRYTVYYMNRADILPLSVGVYKYSTIPKCYTILDQLALDVSGIIKVQTQRNLGLKGNGILMGFIDTGERVIIMSS